MDARTLFDHVVRDLSDRLQTPDDEYAIVRASGLLRLLLLDERPLLTQAHRKARVRFVVARPAFRIRLQSTGPETRSGMLVGFNLAAQRGAAADSLPLPGFLAAPAASSSWTGDISVRQAIKCGAHAFGGVHFDRATDHDIRVIADILEHPDDQSIAVLCRMLVQIGEVVVRATSPLIR